MKQEATMRVVLFPVGEPPRVVEVPAGLTGMRSLIKSEKHPDPTLQFITIGRPSAAFKGQRLRMMQIICDDNGTIYEPPLPPNRQVGPKMTIVGPFFVTAVDLVGEPPQEEPDNVSLNEAEVNLILHMPWKVVS